jgi:hypothetical protein
MILRPLILVFVALLVASCGTPDQIAPSATGTTTPSSTTTTTTTDGSLEFVFEDPYAVGEKILVRLRNDDHRSYTYNQAYEACEMRYFDDSGRHFIIPPGTHCDIEDNVLIGPGETVTLFTWDLDECVKDVGGCAKAKQLEPGKYRVVGWFRPAGGGEVVRVEAKLVILES